MSNLCVRFSSVYKLDIEYLRREFADEHCIQFFVCRYRSESFTGFLIPRDGAMLRVWPILFHGSHSIQTALDGKERGHGQTRRELLDVRLLHYFAVAVVHKADLVFLRPFRLSDYLCPVVSIVFTELTTTGHTWHKNIGREWFEMPDRVRVVQVFHDVFETVKTARELHPKLAWRVGEASVHLLPAAYYDVVSADTVLAITFRDQLLSKRLCCTLILK